MVFNAYNMIIIYNNFKLYFEQLKKNEKYGETEPLLDKTKKN